MKKTGYLSRYYGKNGSYLKEHEDFLASAKVEKDIAFIIKSLKLKKSETVLDIACGQGRHTSALAEKGYHADGVDFSSFLLDVARLGSERLGKHRPDFFQSNVEKLVLPKKYDKAFWFFSDLAQIDLSKALVSIGRVMKRGGTILLDTDSVFRIIAFLIRHPESEYSFDPRAMALVDKGRGLAVPYPTLGMWEEWLMKAGFSLVGAYGDYDFGRYTFRSQRLMILAKKIRP